MKRKSLKFIALVLLLITIAIACKKEPVQGVIIDGTLLIDVGETVTLTPTFVPSNATNKNVNWESNDPNVATVDNGKVTGKAAGRATIKVITEDGGKTATCLVTVILPIEPEDMIWVEGGPFMMGCNDDECDNIELPRHEVTLSGFYISRYVVTQKEWIAAMGNISYPFIGDDLPASGTWNDIQIYISRLNAFTGKNYRLPTEAEWEYAARGGNKSQGYKYSGSNNIGEVAWYFINAYDRLQPVGQKNPNELGIYDMSGNMCEWCSDYLGNYTDASQMNPTGPVTGTLRIFRGGCWNDPAFNSRVSRRGYGFPDVYAFSFRLVHP